MEFSNGMLIQYGKNALNANNWTYINLPTSYTTTTYSVVAQGTSWCHGNYWGTLQSSQPNTTSQIMIGTSQDNNLPACWITMGY